MAGGADGLFDAAFLEIPEEVIRATIRNNQKCFVVRDPKTGKLANKFILVSNIEASDGGKAIVAGCERVIRARLSDAKFFYETDLKTRLEDRLPKFEHIVFHEKLGTQAERIARIVALAGHLAPVVGADVAKAERAAQLCKADLLTEVVGEFPELQGLMGRYYAEAQNEDEAIAHACEDHYHPKGPDDLVPADPVSVAVALADKIDILTGFWAIDEKPTGSKDPYALRRAALGVIRLLLANEHRLSFRQLVVRVQRELQKTKIRQTLKTPFSEVAILYPVQVGDETQLRPFNFPMADENPYEWILESAERRGFFKSGFTVELIKSIGKQRIQPWGVPHPSEHAFSPEDVLRVEISPPDSNLPDSLLLFIADRLKVQLREQGARHDLVDAVFSLSAPSIPALVPITDSARAKEPLRDMRAASQKRSIWNFVLSFVRRLFGRQAQLQEDFAEKAAAPAPVSTVAVDDGVQDDLVLIVHRVEALGKFLDTDDGKNLLAGSKRATNIIRIEERKDKRDYTGAPDAALYSVPEEKELARAIGMARTEAGAAVAKEDFAAAMTAMAKLRPHVDAFFDKVTVNVDDKALRENRLKLLNEIRQATRAVADFSKIEG